MGVPVVSGEDVSMAKVCLYVAARLLLAQRSAGVVHFLASCTPACMRSPTKGVTRFVRACFMVFPLSTSPARRTLAAAQGP